MSHHTIQMPERQVCLEACLQYFKAYEYRGEQCFGMPEMAGCAKACFDCSTTCCACFSTANKISHFAANLLFVSNI